MTNMPAKRILVAVALALTTAGAAAAAEPAALLKRSAQAVPAPPWQAGEQRGMANAIGVGTWARCAWHLQQPGAQSFELSYERSNTMPKSAFSGPYDYDYGATKGLPGTLHAFNGEALRAGAEPGAQATQMDALGHFAHLSKPWDGQGAPPADEAEYYGGLRQRDVKPEPSSPLLKLGIEQAPPLVTSGVLLDAKRYLNGGQPMKAGQLVTADGIRQMLKAQGLEKRGILPGDVVWVRTGWGDHWQDPDLEKTYYTKGPGLSYDAAKWLAEKRIVLVGLDTPFVDPVPDGMLMGKSEPAEGTPPGLPFVLHHQMLSVAGIHLIQNANLTEAANAGVWTSCTMVLPIRERGAAGSPVRPVAIGVPTVRGAGK
jgi:kynurenine formamidase